MFAILKIAVNVEEQAILSALIIKKIFMTLNLATLDPSESMKNFIHNMNFKKMLSFQPIKPIVYADFTFEEKKYSKSIIHKEYEENVV